MFSKPEKIVFDTLFEAISEAVIVVDEFQKIKVINSSAEKIFGYHQSEILEKPLSILIPKEHKENYENHFNSFLNYEEKRQMGKGDDIYAIRKNKNVFPIEVGLNPFEIQGKKYIMVLVVDVTLQKRKNLEILELNTKLENSVRERTRRLSDTVEKLEKMNKQLDEENKKRIEAETKAQITLKKERELNNLKTKFLSMVSHEFKTPLTGISVSTMLLGKYNLTKQQKKRDKYLAIINSKVHYLNSVLNNFLSIEKLDKKGIKYNITTFNLKKVMDEVVTSSNLLFKEGQEIVYISNFDNVSIHQDQKIIELTLSNLLSNAIKYSFEHTKIFIAVAKDEENTVIRIIDRGFGIPKKEQKNIFKRYFRAENVLLIEGTGIGLNIIKTHIENLGGTIIFKSEENKGTTFIVTIPNKFN